MKTFVHGLMIDTIAFTRDHTCVPLGGSGLGFVIQDHTDHGASKEWSFHQISYHNSRRESVERISGIAR